MVKRKQPSERSPSPNPKRLREAGVKFIILPPDAPTIKSYGEDHYDELKAKASAQLEFLMNQAAILRDAPPPPPPKTKAANTKGKGKGKAAKGKGKAAKGKGKASKNQVPEEPEWLPGWNFFHKKRIPRALSKLIQPQLDYIEQMIKGWRPPAPKKMGMPEDWFQEEVVIVLANNRPWDMEKYDREKVNKTRMSFYVEPIGEHLDRISTKNLIRRHLSTRLSQAILPDFCLPFRVTRPEEQYGTSNIEIYPSLERWLDIMNFPMGEHNVEICVLSAFTNIPLLWMLMHPKQRFLEPLAFEEPGLKTEFALVLNTVRPFSKVVDATREIPISYNNPALLIGMKGPVQWPDFLQKWDQPPHFGTEEWNELSEEERLDWCVENLACAIQPSLDVLIMTWCLRVTQQATIFKAENLEPYPMMPAAEEGEDISEFLPDPKDAEQHPDPLEWSELPAWAWIPGILYDYDMCYLVAHIPLLPADRLGTEPVEYISYVFDEIPILRPPDGDSDDRYCLIERARLGLAWMALSKHCNRLASLWDSVQQPMDVERWEEVVDMAIIPPGLIPEREERTRQPTRLARANGDRYRRPTEYASDAESMHNYQNQDIEKALSVDGEVIAEYEKRIESWVPKLKEAVAPKVEKWMSQVKEGYWELCEGVEVDASEEEDEGSGDDLEQPSSSLTSLSDD